MVGKIDHLIMYGHFAVKSNWSLWINTIQYQDRIKISEIIPIRKSRCLIISHTFLPRFSADDNKYSLREAIERGLGDRPRFSIRPLSRGRI